MWQKDNNVTKSSQISVNKLCYGRFFNITGFHLSIFQYILHMFDSLSKSNMLSYTQQTDTYLKITTSHYVLPDKRNSNSIIGISSVTSVAQIPLRALKFMTQYVHVSKHHGHHGT